MTCRACKTAVANYTCGKCNTARYCSIQCQSSDWATHASKCAADSNLHAMAVSNTEPFVLLYADSCVELAVEALAPNVVLGPETHKKSTQIIRVESGSAKFVINNKEATGELFENSTVIIPANTPHTVMAGPTGIKFSTTYSPPRESGIKQ